MAGGNPHRRKISGTSSPFMLRTTSLSSRWSSKAGQCHHKCSGAQSAAPQCGHRSSSMSAAC
eukprot:10564335-Alexandrium_andersonii.AAC.1